MPKAEPTRQQLIDAAVAVVEKQAKDALEDEETDGYGSREYTETYQVSSALQKQGLISHPHSDARYLREDARKSMEGKVRRLLDAEAAKPEGARILRFSPRDHKLLPRLDGSMRGIYAQGVGYTTPECYERALAAVAARKAQERAEHDAMQALLREAAEAGLPMPIKHTPHEVTFALDGLRELIDRYNAAI